MKRVPNKSLQQRSGTRAPHGSPIYTRQVGSWVTDDQFQLFHRLGGSAWLRSALDAAPKPVSPAEQKRIDAARAGLRPKPRSTVLEAFVNASAVRNL